MAPKIYANLDPNDGEDLFLAVHVFLVHNLPLLQSTCNIILSDMTLLEDDTFLVFVSGMIYIACNYFGYVSMGHTVYDQDNWDNKPFETMSAYTLIAAAMAGLY